MRNDVKKLNKRVDRLLTQKAAKEAQLAELMEYVSFCVCAFAFVQYMTGRYESYVTWFPYICCKDVFGDTKDEYNCQEPS